MKLRSQFKHDAAFTLIEIAISLGVIAVALIAIMGALPAGMQVQRVNRQDTVINADGTYLLEAIRTSAANIPDLVKYSEVISNQPVTATMTSADVVRLMCAPGPKRTNVFHAISGAAALRGVGVPSFRYMVLSEVGQVPNVNTNLPHADLIEKNTYELRLVFLWPLKPYSSQVADVSQKQVFRTLISGRWDDLEGQFKVAEFVP
jgi:type II secretory pathway pseudopilin PulG